MMPCSSLGSVPAASGLLDVGLDVLALVAEGIVAAGKLSEVPAVHFEALALVAEGLHGVVVDRCSRIDSCPGVIALVAEAPSEAEEFLGVVVGRRPHLHPHPGVFALVAEAPDEDDELEAGDPDTWHLHP